MKKAQIRELRHKLRIEVFNRDDHRCRVCGRRPDNGDEGLDAHHIEDRHSMPGGGYVLENLISVCKDGLDNCHLKAEAEHRGEVPEPGYSRAELYALIGTTFDEAWEASEKLMDPT